jgi:hypothetical protein
MEQAIRLNSQQLTLLQETMLEQAHERDNDTYAEFIQELVRKVGARVDRAYGRVALWDTYPSALLSSANPRTKSVECGFAMHEPVH